MTSVTRAALLFGVELDITESRWGEVLPLWRRNGEDSCPRQHREASRGLRPDGLSVESPICSRCFLRETTRRTRHLTTPGSWCSDLDPRRRRQQPVGRQGGVRELKFLKMGTHGLTTFATRSRACTRNCSALTCSHCATIKASDVSASRTRRCSPAARSCSSRPPRALRSRNPRRRAMSAAR